MPGLDLSQLSSNWKKLQQQPVERSQPVKRSENISDVNSKPAGASKKPTMSTYASREHAYPAAHTARSTLVKEHGIAANDIYAAYGTTTPLPHLYTDETNGALHPTHKAGKFVALDCEMVGTGPPPHTDNLLARASLVNFHGEQIYDSYVLPPPGEKVEDYRTFVSGIKPSHLRPSYARPFAEVQESVAQLLEGRILVGHALRHDLQALSLSHPTRDLRDTSRHPKYRIGSKGKSPALRNLARQELKLSIQTGEHCSIEDARVAMMLFKKDKAGFEAENRKHFGQHMRSAQKAANGVKAASPVAGSEDKDGDGEDDNDLDLLDDEINDFDGESAPSKSAATAKKKRKKKKRTKRQ